MSTSSILNCRVRQGEKDSLKTDGSNRRIQIRQPIKDAKSLSKMNNGKWESVYTRNGKLWITFNYMNHRVREGSGLDDIKQNRNKLRLFLDKVYVGIQEGSFRVGDYFPKSNKREFFTILEGGTVMTDPSSIRFGEY